MSLFRTRTSQSQRSHRSQNSHANLIAQDSPSQDQSRPTLERYPSRSEIYQVTSSSSNADPLAGYLNHLTEKQQSQLLKFKSILHDQALYRAAGAVHGPSHDDQTLLRYLRARKFDVQGAVAQFRDTENWYTENNISELYETIDVEFYERARRMYPQWTGRRDRRGIPVYLYVIKHLDSKNVNAYTNEAADYKAKLPSHSSLSTPAKQLPLFALYENLLRFTLPLCTSIDARPNPEVPVTNSVNIVDITGVGMRQFWNLKNHMQEASVLATAHYPETLDRIFIIGAPSFFPTVWAWIKRWFDPVTVNKIFILSQHEVKSRLSEFIDPDDIPTQYGGKLEFEVGMPPNMDQPAKDAVEKNGTTGWIKGPCMWEQNQRIPVGTLDGKARRPTIVLPIAPPTPTPVPNVLPPPQLSTPSQPSPPTATATATATAVPAPPPAPAPPTSIPTPTPIAQQSHPTTSGPLPSSSPAPTSSQPPSMAHSGSGSSSSASTSTSTQPDDPPRAVAPGPALLLAADHDHDDDKARPRPRVERFVTAVEEFETVTV